jgi:predicted outer membrane protein
MFDLAAEPDLAHKAVATTLKLLSGNMFDREYIKHAGEGDHQRTVDLLQEVQNNAKGKNLKAYAGNASGRPGHLKMTQSIEKQMKQALEAWVQPLGRTRQKWRSMLLIK